MRIWKSALSGILAASAGVFGKFSFQDSEDPWHHKLFSFLVMFLLNSQMINFIVQSFKELGAAKTTVINLAFNYIFSAFLASLIYQETISPTWATGAVLMFTGVLIINSDT